MVDGEYLKGQLSRIEDLSPEGQARISEVLKSAIEREVAAGGGAGLRASGQFSRGWIFSRVVSASRLEEQVILPMAQSMSDQDFSAFAQRLSELKKLKDG